MDSVRSRLKDRQRTDRPNFEQFLLLGGWSGSSVTRETRVSGWSFLVEFFISSDVCLDVGQFRSRGHSFQAIWMKLRTRIFLDF